MKYAPSAACSVLCAVVRAETDIFLFRSDTSSQQLDSSGIVFLFSHGALMFFMINTFIYLSIYDRNLSVERLRVILRRCRLFLLI